MRKFFNVIIHHHVVECERKYVYTYAYLGHTGYTICIVLTCQRLTYLKEAFSLATALKFLLYICTIVHILHIYPVCNIKLALLLE